MSDKTMRSTHFKLKQRGDSIRWSLKYSSDEQSVNHPVFDGLLQVEISSVMQFVNRHCDFMSHFDHVLGRYVKKELDETAISA